MEYKSRASLFGLPLLHVCLGQMVNGVYRRGAARGWVAIGDSAIGVLFAAGGFACGGIAFGGLTCGLIAVGGLSLGVLALAGLAVGGYAVGGLAIGIIAVGGLALGGYAAFGGGAIAFQYSVGGLAIAQHANDSAAQEFMNSALMRAGKFLTTLPAWAWWVPAAVFALPILIMNRIRGRRPTQ